MLKEEKTSFNSFESQSSSENIPVNIKVISLLKSFERKESVVSGVNEAAKNFNIYETDYKSNLHSNNNLTFHIGTDSFELPESLRNNLEKHGKSIASYYKACDDLFISLSSEHKWKKALSSGKPEWLLREALKEGDKASHVFLRPDFILTEDGVITTEIETSPFGLALSSFLNKSYSQEGIETAVDPDLLMKFFIDEVLEGDPIGKSLCFVLTEHTQKYIGQFEYLQRELLTLQQKGLHFCDVNFEYE